MSATKEIYMDYFVLARIRTPLRCSIGRSQLHHCYLYGLVQIIQRTVLQPTIVHEFEKEQKYSGE